MVVAETWIPRRRSSPWIRWYPHLGFSLARRRPGSGSQDRWPVVRLAGGASSTSSPRAGGATEGASRGKRGMSATPFGEGPYSAARKALSEAR